ncbi:MAG TPA: cyclic nucleotide-binding domain-containing protein [Sporichthyaceae bacterium]|nr:cyclic nucleotide-binding domain-containing protein [Sporichthyaceae bacterium]
MKRRDQHLDQLRAVPLFSLCSKAELRLISAHSMLTLIPAGKVLVREQQHGDEFFVVALGEAEVTRNGVFVNKLGPGSYFGELALLDPAPRDATVTAITDMEIYRLTSSEFSTVLIEVPSVTRKVLRGMAKRLRQFDLDQAT